MIREQLLALHADFLSSTSQIPDDYQDWRAEFAGQLRSLAAEPVGGDGTSSVPAQPKWNVGEAVAAWLRNYTKDQHILKEAETLWNWAHNLPPTSTQPDSAEGDFCTTCDGEGHTFDSNACETCGGSGVLRAMDDGRGEVIKGTWTDKVADPFREQPRAEGGVISTVEERMINLLIALKDAGIDVSSDDEGLKWKVSAAPQPEQCGFCGKVGKHAVNEKCPDLNKSFLETQPEQPARDGVQELYEKWLLIYGPNDGQTRALGKAIASKPPHQADGGAVAWWLDPRSESVISAELKQANPQYTDWDIPLYAAHPPKSPGVSEQMVSRGLDAFIESSRNDDDRITKVRKILLAALGGEK